MIFRKWGGGVKGRSELFRKFIRFGVAVIKMFSNVILKYESLGCCRPYLCSAFNLHAERPWGNLWQKQGKQFWKKFYVRNINMGVHGNTKKPSKDIKVRKGVLWRKSFIFDLAQELNVFLSCLAFLTDSTCLWFWFGFSRFLASW